MQDEKLAKVDAAQMIFCESKTQSGNYNISYITGIRYSNLISVVLVIAPVDDPDE